MQIDQGKTSRKKLQALGALVALGLLQVPLVSLADAPAPWVHKAEQKKAKKKKKSARRAPRRPVQQTQTVYENPQPPVQVAEAPLPPAPVEVAPPPPEAPAPVAPPVAPPPAEPIPAAAASGGGTGWLLPVLGIVGLGGLVAALAGDSNG